MVVGRSSDWSSWWVLVVVAGGFFAVGVHGVGCSSSCSRWVMGVVVVGFVCVVMVVVRV